MAHIKLNNVSLSYPIFGAQSRSLKRNIINMTVGGKLNVHDHSILIDALSNISFTLNGGDRLALIGHNGSGKTTLLRILAGVYIPTHGQLTTNGSISALLDTILGMVHEATGHENVKIRSLLHG